MQNGESRNVIFSVKFAYVRDLKFPNLKMDAVTAIHARNTRQNRYIADAAQAVSVLVHETWKNEKFLADLTAEQKSLVMGVVVFCREIEKEYGFPDLS